MKNESTEKESDYPTAEENKIEKSKEKAETAKKSGGKMKAAVALVIFVIAAAGVLFYLSSGKQEQQNPYQMKFANETLNFRADLRKAALTPVFPDEQTIRNAVLSENVSTIKIVYVPDNDYNSFYAVDSFELAYKLVIIFKHYYGTNGYLYAGENGESCLSFEETGRNVCIQSEHVPSESDINAGKAETAIFLASANETSVSLQDNIIYIKGEMKGSNPYVSGVKYTNLDLATDRLLLALTK